MVGISNQEPCSGLEKASNTLVRGKRAAKTRRRINLGTLILHLFQECKLGRKPLARNGGQRGSGDPAVVCLGSSGSHMQLPALTGAAAPCSSPGVLGHSCTSPQGILRLNVTLRNAVTSLLFKYIFSPLPVIKVQGRDASFLVDICFDS